MIKRFIKKAIQDIPQQLSRSVDFYPGTAETTNTPGYDGKSNFKREWNLPEGWKDDYSQQSDNFNSTLTTNIPRGASNEQLFQVMSREHPNLTHEQFEELLKNNPQNRIASKSLQHNPESGHSSWQADDARIVDYLFRCASITQNKITPKGIIKSSKVTGYEEIEGLEQVLEAYITYQRLRGQGELDLPSLETQYKIIENYKIQAIGDLKRLYTEELNVMKNSIAFMRELQSLDMHALESKLAEGAYRDLISKVMSNKLKKDPTIENISVGLLSSHPRVREDAEKLNKERTSSQDLAEREDEWDIKAFTASSLITKTSSEVINEIVDKIKGTDAVNDILESESPDQEINIEITELGNGAVAETLPNGTILINDDIEEVDDFTASRLVHELSHYVDWQEENYLDRPEEKDAFTAQIQYLLEVGNSQEDIKKMILPIFEDYKGEDGEEALDNMIDQAKKNHKKASQILSKIAQEVPKLTFTQEETVILDKIRAAADKLGIKVFLAGGLIRDRLSGIENTDLDFVTNKGSEQLAALLAKTYGLSQPIKMDRSGATMINMNGKPIDIIDAEKVFTPAKLKNDSLEEGAESELSIFMDDAYRRDLTINSLMYGLQSGKLYDPTGRGLSDLKNKIIRTIIDPALKYRIQTPDLLRAIRFAATKPGFKFAPGMLEAMRANVSKLTPRQRGGDTSSRRIERELRKCKTTEEWARCKATLADIGAYEHIGDEIKNVDADKKGGIKYDFEKEKVASLNRKFITASQFLKATKYTQRAPEISKGNTLGGLISYTSAQLAKGKFLKEETFMQLAEYHDLLTPSFPETRDFIQSTKSFTNDLDRWLSTEFNKKELQDYLDQWSSIKPEIKKEYDDFFSNFMKTWSTAAKLLDGVDQAILSDKFSNLEKMLNVSKNKIHKAIILEGIKRYLIQASDLTMGATSDMSEVRLIAEQLNKEASAQKDAIIKYSKQSNQLLQTFLKMAELEGTAKLAADFAGRPLADGPALPSEILSPYSMPHNNYNAEETLKRKELEEKVKKLKEMSNKYKETQK
jgi:tRNA nucleotidyltransferase/poly(A) polymerase